MDATDRGGTAEPLDLSVPGDLLAELELRTKVGQLVHVGFDGTDFTASLREVVEEYCVGGVVYFDRNVESRTQLEQLSERIRRTAIEATGVPPLISVDQEGGLVTRIPVGTVPPGQMALGATADEDLAREFGRAVGSQLHSVGITTNFAPVLDVNSNPDNPVIGSRSFGEDPEFVAEMGRAVLEGLRDAGIVPCAKHFPGHGDTARDSHRTLPVVSHDRDRLDAVELRPFRAAIDAGVDALMTAHVAFPAITNDPTLPATMSQSVLTGVLREELGFDGVVVTDCIEMDAIADGIGSIDGAIRAIEAGADTVLVSHTPSLAGTVIDRVVDAVREGRLSERRVDTAVRRVLALKDRRIRSASPDDLASGGAAHAGTGGPLEISDAIEVWERIAKSTVTVINDTDLLPLDPARVLIWDARPTADAPSRPADELATRLAERNVTVRVSSSSETAVSPARDETVLAVTTDASSDSAQLSAVETVLDDHDSVVACAVSNPYDLCLLPPEMPALTTYDTSPVVLAAAAAVLAGEIEPSGSLPFELE